MLAATEVTLDRGTRGIRLENDRVLVTLLPDKGADIYEWVHKQTGVDVLWKSPRGLRSPGAGIPSSFDSSVPWIEWYPGSRQVLFPSGVAPCLYKGVELNYHGEASTISWDITELESNKREARVHLTTRLCRIPIILTREIVSSKDSSSFLLRESICNDGGEALDYMWGHHPAYGAPFLSADCRIDTNARRLVAGDTYDPLASVIELAREHVWPTVERNGMQTDLSNVPDEDAVRTSLAYFDDYDDVAWYGITNTHLGFGAGLAWQRKDVPHSWFWQEMHASPGFSWYKGVYVMAIEPNTTWPGQGLIAASVKTGAQRTLHPGETCTAEIRSVLYDTHPGIGGIDMEGNVQT